MNYENAVYALAVVAGLIIGWRVFRRWLKFFYSRFNDAYRRKEFAEFLKRPGWTVIEKPKAVKPTSHTVTLSPSEWGQIYEAKSGVAVISATQVGTGKVNDISVIVGYGLAFAAQDDENVKEYVSYWKLTLPGHAPGWLRLRSSDSYFKGHIRETDLESIEFNKKIQLHAHPRDLAFKLLHPDFMEWYLKNAVRPWIHIDGDQLLVVYEVAWKELRMDEQMKDVVFIVNAITRSGTLAAQGDKGLSQSEYAQMKALEKELSKTRQKQ